MKSSLLFCEPIYCHRKTRICDKAYFIGHSVQLKHIMKLCILQRDWNVGDFSKLSRFYETESYHEFLFSKKTPSLLSFSSRSMCSISLTRLFNDWFSLWHTGKLTSCQKFIKELRQILQDSNDVSYLNQHFFVHFWRCSKILDRRISFGK